MTEFHIGDHVRLLTPHWNDALTGFTGIIVPKDPNQPVNPNSFEVHLDQPNPRWREHMDHNAHTVWVEPEYLELEPTHPSLHGDWS